MQNTGQTIAHEFVKMDKEASLNYPYEEVVLLLDEVISECINRISLTSGNPLVILRRIHEIIVNMGFVYKYQPSDQPHNNTMLLDFLDKRINCRGFATLYIAIGQALNLPFFMVNVPRHVFIRCKFNDGHFINWETTSGESLDNEHYISKYRISPGSIENGVFLENRNLNDIRGIYYFCRSIIYRQKKEFQKALDDINRAIIKVPKIIDFHLAKIATYISIAKDIIKLPRGVALKDAFRGRLTSGSQELMRKALYELDRLENLNLDTTYPLVHSSRADVHFWMGNTEKCLELLNENIKRFPNDPRVYIARAEFHNYYREGLNSFDRLTQRLTRFSMSEPDDKLKEDPSLIDYSDAIRLDDNKNADYYMYRGTCFENRGAWKLALKDYKKASDLEQNNPETYYKLGNGVRYTTRMKFWKKVHKTPDAQELMRYAIEQFDKAIYLDKNYAAAYRCKGQAFLELPGKMIEGFDLIKKAIELNPYSGISQKELIEAYEIVIQNTDVDDPKLLSIISDLRNDLGLNFTKNADIIRLNDELKKIIISYNFDQFNVYNDKESEEQRKQRWTNERFHKENCARDIFKKFIGFDNLSDFQKAVLEEKYKYSLSSTIEMTHNYMKATQFTFYVESFITTAKSLDNDDFQEIIDGDRNIIDVDTKTETDLDMFCFSLACIYYDKIEKKAGIEDFKFEYNLVSKIIDDELEDDFEKELEKIVKKSKNENNQSIFNIVGYDVLISLLKEHNKNIIEYIIHLNEKWSDQFFCLREIQHDIRRPFEYMSKVKIKEIEKELFKFMLIPDR